MPRFVEFSVILRREIGLLHIPFFHFILSFCQVRGMYQLYDQSRILCRGFV